MDNAVSPRCPKCCTKNHIIKYISACGLPNKNRIVGGTAVRSNKYPWTVQLLQGRNGRLFCGGTLIQSQYVLTAAHCVHGMRWQNIHVRLNQYDRNAGSAAAITKSISKATVHEEYNTSTLVNDIAILKLSEAVPINGDIRPACLPPNGNYNVNNKLVGLFLYIYHSSNIKNYVYLGHCCRMGFDTRTRIHFKPPS